MKLRPLWILVCCLLGSVALAQRDAPVWECYLPSINVMHADGDRIDFDLVFKKETGPVEHKEHQMYLLAYLTEDEAEIMKISEDLKLLDKKSEGKQFFDVLTEEGLVAVIAIQVAPRQGFAGQDMVGRYSDGSDAGRAKEAFLKLNTFSFQFSATYEDLYREVAKLKHFDANKRGPFGYFEDNFKVLAFVPVNDSKYATDVREGVKGENDFANGGFEKDANGDPLSRSTPILYFRPLPYEFELRRLDEGKDAGKLLLYIN